MKKTIGTEDFKAMFREIGLDEAAMLKWHQVFEKRHPESHQSFLEWLGAPAALITEIRAKSR